VRRPVDAATICLEDYATYFPSERRADRLHGGADASTAAR
jgi:hypothetical protein